MILWFGCSQFSCLEGRQTSWSNCLLTYCSYYLSLRCLEPNWAKAKNLYSDLSRHCDFNVIRREFCQSQFEALFDLFSLFSVTLNPVNLLIIAAFTGLKAMTCMWFDGILTLFNVVCCWSASFPFVWLQISRENEECEWCWANVKWKT